MGEGPRKEGVSHGEEKLQGCGREWKGGALYYCLNMNQGYDGAVIHAPGEMPYPTALGPEPVHQRDLSHGAHVTQGMEAEPVQGDFKVGGYREQVDGVRGKE